MTRRRTRDQDLPAGISRVHRDGCPAGASGDVADCGCRPRYQAQAGPKKSRKTRTWPTRAAAVAWKREIEDAFASGEHLRPTHPTFREVADAWLVKARAGAVRTRKGETYKPATIRGYENYLRTHLFDEIGGVPVDELTRGRLNELVQALQARGLAEQTVRNALVPARAILRDQVDLERLPGNVSNGVKVPTGSGARMRTVEPSRVDAYLAALPALDRPVWATAILAGLRRGELMALRWADVDLASGLIVVRFSHDPVSGTTGRVKTKAGQDRRVPISGTLRDHLLQHRQRVDGRPQGLVFPRSAAAGRGPRSTAGDLRDLDAAVLAAVRRGVVTRRALVEQLGTQRRITDSLQRLQDAGCVTAAGRARARTFHATGVALSAGAAPAGGDSAALPFDAPSLTRRAATAWHGAGLQPITLHDGRHTFASLMIEAMAAQAVFNPKLLQDMLGHASIQQTYDRYGHLFPGAHAEAGRMLDSMLANIGNTEAEVEVAVDHIIAALGAADPAAGRAAAARAEHRLREWQRAADERADGDSSCTPPSGGAASVQSTDQIGEA